MAIDFEERVKARRQAIEASLGQVNTSQWTLLTAAGFIILAALSTTHQDLLVGRTFQLPVIAANASLVPFYVLAPVLLVLLQVALVGSYFGRRRTLQRHEEEVALAPIEAQGFHRSDLPEAAELDIAGRRRPDHRSIRKRTERVLKRMALLWLVPSVLLLLQWRFAPYQHRAVTALHLVLFAGTVWGTFMALPYLRWQTPPGVRQMLGRALRHRRRGLAVRALVSLASLYLMAAASLGLPAARLQPGGMPMQIVTATGAAMRVTELSEGAMARRQDALSAGTITAAHYLTAGLARFDGIQGPDLRGRRLRHADLSQLGLVRADLGSAVLIGANLDNADLRGADLSYAHLDNARLDLANLTHVVARSATARLASFAGANMFAADLTGARLEGSAFYFLRSDDPGPWPVLYQSGFCQPRFDDADLRGTSFLGSQEEVASADVHVSCPGAGTMTMAGACRTGRLTMMPKGGGVEAARVSLAGMKPQTEGRDLDQIERVTAVAASIVDQGTLKHFIGQVQRVRDGAFGPDPAGDVEGQKACETSRRGGARLGLRRGTRPAAARRALGAGHRLAAALTATAHFTAPSASPLTSERCKSAKTTATGTLASSVAAITCSHSTL